LLSRDKPHKPILFSLRDTNFKQEKVVNRMTAELLLPEFVLRGAVDIFLASGFDDVNNEFIHEISLKKWGNRIKCHAELVSASNKINKLSDPEINSG
jgi:hypothetical protein